MIAPFTMGLAALFTPRRWRQKPSCGGIASVCWRGGRQDAFRLHDVRVSEPRLLMRSDNYSVASG